MTAPDLADLQRLAAAVHPSDLDEDDPRYLAHPALAQQQALRQQALADPGPWQRVLAVLRQELPTDAVWDWTQPYATCCRHVRVRVPSSEAGVREVHLAVSFVAPVFVVYQTTTPTTASGFGPPRVDVPQGAAAEVAARLVELAEAELGVALLPWDQSAVPMPTLGVRGLPVGEATLRDALFTSTLA